MTGEHQVEGAISEREGRAGGRHEGWTGVMADVGPGLALQLLGR